MLIPAWAPGRGPGAEWRADALRLEPGRVHIWRIALDGPAAAPAALSADEQARAARFHFEPDRRRFRVSHQALRVILGAYLGQAPEELAFHVGPRGKPALASERLRFNLAHSGELALVAVSLAGALGVDVEQTRALPDALELAKHFFAPEEQRDLQAAAQAGQTSQAFFNAWTRKEAFIKATGDGLARGLDTFAVTLLPGQPARFTRIADARWQLAAFEPAPGYAAALAADGPLANIRFWEY